MLSERLTWAIERKQRRDGQKITKAAIARVVGRSPAAVSYWFDDANGIDAENARKVGEFLDVDPVWLETGEGNPERRRQASNVRPGPEILGMIPLISWVRAGEFCDSPDNFAPGDADRWLPCPVPHGPRTFALEVVGQSMDGDDGYREGEYIFVDPDQSEPRPNKDFIFKHTDGTSTFKRLKQELDGWYLLALNPNWDPKFMKMPDGTHICGRVIYSARDR